MIEQVNNSNEAAFIVYLLILLILGIAKQSEGNRLGVFLNSFFNTLLVDQQLRQERAFVRVGSFVVVISLLITSVFITQLLEYYQLSGGFSFGALLSLVIIGLLLFSAFRMAVYTAFSWLFEVENLQVLHTFHWLLSSFLWALVLLPFSVLITFGNSSWTPYLLGTGLIIGGLLFVIRTFRVFGAGISNFRISLIYNIFYLCALEILPSITLIVVIFRQKAG